jgi:pimeloyl-ACP methyl ester carboxylesterase
MVLRLRRNIVRITRSLLLVCLSLSLLSFYPVFAQSSVTGFEPAACPFDVPTGQTVECGYLTVTEDRSAPSGATIRLAVAVFRSPNPDKAADPIVYLEGGPGGEPLEALPLLFERQYAPMLENRDVIVFDQRGTGYSEPSLACPEFIEFGLDYLDDDLPPDESRELATDALLECRTRLAGEGADLSAYNSAESAADVNDLRLALGYDQWNLWGVSYGTRLALTILRDHPEGVRSAVLDSAYPLESNLYADLPANAARAFDTLLAGCTADPACNSAYPDLERVLYEVVDRLDENPVTLTVTNPLNGRSYDALVTGDALLAFIFQSLYVSDLIPLLPQIVFEVQADNYDSIEQLFGAFLANGDFVSIGMQTSVQCHEEAAFTSVEDIRAGYAAFPELRSAMEASPTLGPGIVQLCEAWGAGEAGGLENEPVHSDIATLVLAGEYDPITPPDWGRQVTDSLENSFFVQFPGQGHGPSLQNGCARSVVLEFFDDPTTQPEAACVAEMSAPAFSVSEEPATDIALEPFTNDTFGISGVIPQGWAEAAPGVYRRGESALDPVALIQQVAPGTDVQTLLTTLQSQLRLETMPDSVGSRDANGLTWTLYELEIQGIAVDLALAEQDGTSYLVLMQYPADEREAFYSPVFLAAVDALMPA